MGLKEKQVMNDLQEKVIPSKQNYIKQHGLDIALKVKWDTIPTTGTTALGRCETLLGSFANYFWDFGQDKIAKDEISKKIKSVTIQHDGTITDPEAYKMNLNGTDLSFAANLEIFTLGGGKQKSPKKAIGEML